MRKEYVTPATQEQSMTMCQLMVGSATPGINVNTDPITGEPAGPIFGK